MLYCNHIRLMIPSGRSGSTLPKTGAGGVPTQLWFVAFRAKQEGGIFLRCNVFGLKGRLAKNILGMQSEMENVEGFAWKLSSKP